MTPTCPSCRTRSRRPGQYLCPLCWGQLPRPAQRALTRRGDRGQALARLRQLHDQLATGVPLTVIRIVA
ncbi:hypothetical protein ACWD3Z_05445 [Streptomyces sp. NPDC002740]